jgi:acyl carrier protein
MHSELETAARDRLAESIDDVDPAEIDLDRSMVDDYGLTSLNKVLLFTGLCDDTGVGIGNFTEQDLARVRTLRDVIDAFAAHAGKAGV